MERRAVFLMGPTASGKTELALALADSFPLALINADSAQVYRGMDVGTAKPSPDVRARYPHALMDFRDPVEPFSAGEYARLARDAVEAAFGAGKTPLLVGGTGLYFRAFAEGLAEMPAADPAIRERLRGEGERLGWPTLHRRLGEVDEAAAARIHPGDSQRIQRALEVYELTGRPLSALQQERDLPPLHYPVLRLALWLPREELWERIETRFRAMLAEGLVEEVEALLAAGVDPDTPALRAVGYRQVAEYLQGRCTYAEMEKAGIVATRQLAKRQLTWFRRTPGVLWFRPEERQAAMDRVARFLEGEE
jgi:tRNA dimethylallyltransferase